jgi:choline dehydrogenase-like flavoprotein
MPEARNSIQNCDAIIISTGQAGPSLAHRLAAAGKTVAVIERGVFRRLCQCRSYSDEDAYRWRLRGAHGAPNGPLRSEDRRNMWPLST